VLYNKEVKIGFGLGANVDVGALEIKLWRYWEHPVNDVLDTVALELSWGNHLQASGVLIHAVSAII
jgi:hypothetical protein